ncbi:glycosyltransferase family 39 protein [bacterium]|nr:glycosyltransferase family 39 protein [bacterium]
MYLITLIGLILRLVFINKPEGLWNDEYVSWMVASTPFGEGFWNEVLKQCHMPFYYLYLKPFAGCSDLVLRLTSAIPSVVAIPVMYLAGKEYSKKIGIFAAAITSVLSFLIYYSQEVRFYSILFLFSALSLLFTIKILKNPSKINLTGYIVSNLLILFTHVLGVIYLAFNVGYIIYKKKILTKKLLIISGIATLFLIFFGMNILSQLPSSQWWGHFSYTNILFLFSDFLSPILTNNINAPSVFFYNMKYAIWLTVPTLIGITGMIFGIKNNKGFASICLGTIVVMSLLAYIDKIVFVTKYAIEILPIFILLISLGFVRLKKAGIILFSLFIAFHLAALFMPNYVTKLPRAEGHKIVGDILNNRKAKNTIFTYYAPDRFYRYWNKSGNTYYISKINRFEYKDNPSKILDEIKPNDTVSVVFLDSVSFFPENYLQRYGKFLPEMFVTFSHIRNSLTKTINGKYKDFVIDQHGSWTVITATKK